MSVETFTMFDRDGNAVQVLKGMRWYALENGYRDAPQEPKPEGWHSRVSQYGPDDFPVLPGPPFPSEEA
jgi:hypothetical protein